MSALVPAAFLAGAGSLIGLRDGTLARDITIRALLGGYVARRRRPWATDLIHHAGYWSHVEHRSGSSSWPIPRVRQCSELGEFAARKNVLSHERPQAGEIFLLWSPARQHFVHAGIVLSAEPMPLYHMDDVDEPHPNRRYECHTVEGEITASGGLSGPHLGRVRRVLSAAKGDRTIRWTELDRRDCGEGWQASREPVPPTNREILRVT